MKKDHTSFWSALAVTLVLGLLLLVLTQTSGSRGRSSVASNVNAVHSASASGSRPLSNDTAVQSVKVDGPDVAQQTLTIPRDEVAEQTVTVKSAR